MTARGSLRGHAIYHDGEDWRYTDTDLRTVDTHADRDCGHCHLPNRDDGHDPCLGELPGVMNACCGHGKPEEAYIQFSPTRDIRGVAAFDRQQEMKKP